MESATAVSLNIMKDTSPGGGMNAIHLIPGQLFTVPLC